MSTDSDSTWIARVIFAMLLAGVAISCAVVVYLATADDRRAPAATSSAEDTVPLVRADRSPVRLPPG